MKEYKIVCGVFTYNVRGNNQKHAIQRAKEKCMEFFGETFRDDEITEIIEVTTPQDKIRALARTLEDERRQLEDDILEAQSEADVDGLDVLEIEYRVVEAKLDVLEEVFEILEGDE